MIDGVPMFAPDLADTESGIDPIGFEKLTRVEADYFWFVTRNELIVGLAKKFFPHARSFLEVGCGHGNVLQAMAGARSWQRLAGSELHPSALVHARSLLPHNVELVQMDARDIPARAAFDLVGAFDVIEHIPEDDRVLAGMRDATRSGGGVMIAVPQHPWLWSYADDVAHHQRRYSRGELEAKLRRAGFEVLFSSSFTSLLLPLMVAARLKGKSKTPEQDFDRQFDLSPAINSVFRTITRIETKVTLGVGPSGWTRSGRRIDRLPGVLSLELCRADITES